VTCYDLLLSKATTPSFFEENSPSKINFPAFLDIFFEKYFFTREVHHFSRGN
jgi:hypothetical protein